MRYTKVIHSTESPLNKLILVLSILVTQVNVWAEKNHICLENNDFFNQLRVESGVDSEKEYESILLSSFKYDQNHSMPLAVFTSLGSAAADAVYIPYQFINYSVQESNKLVFDFISSNEIERSKIINDLVEEFSEKTNASEEQIRQAVKNVVYSNKMCPVSRDYYLCTSEISQEVETDLIPRIKEAIAFEDKNKKTGIHLKVSGFEYKWSSMRVLTYINKLKEKLVEKDPVLVLKNNHHYSLFLDEFYSYLTEVKSIKIVSSHKNMMDQISDEIFNISGQYADDELGESGDY